MNRTLSIVQLPTRHWPGLDRRHRERLGSLGRQTFMGRRFVASLVLGLGGALAVTGCGPVGPAAIPTRAGNTWQEIRDSPLSPRSAAVGVWTGREVLLIGGRDGELCPPNALCLRDGTPLADGAALDPRTGQWRRIADAPVPLGGAAAAVVGQTAYFLPHTPDPAAAATALAYEVDQNRWHWLPVPFGSADHYGLVAAGDQLVAHVTSDEARTGADFIFHPGTATWRALPPDPLGKLAERSIVWTGAELALFGTDPAADPGTNRPPVVRAALLDLATGSWRELSHSTMVSIAPWIVVDGSLVNTAVRGADGDLGSAYPNGGRLDPVTGRWSSLPDLPDGIEHVAGAFTASTAIYFGVQGAVLDTTADRWLRLPVIPDDGGNSHTIVAAGTDLVAFGGVDWTSEVKVELSNSTWIWAPPTTA